VPTKVQVRRRFNRLTYELHAPGWNPKTRAALEHLLRKGAGRHLPVVFDFDNTIICGDVSEATLAVLANSGLLRAARLPATLSPSFRPPGRAKVTLGSSADLLDYYDEFLTPTAHQQPDPTSMANGYVWAVEIMEGLRPLDIVNATRTAFEMSRAPTPAFIKLHSARTAVQIPFFYPEMVELIAQLLRHQFDLWVVSAGNVWSMRWMILHGLNPLLRQLGLDRGLRPEQLIGVATLLAGRNHRLYKDVILVRENPSYAALDPKTLATFRLTSRLQFPVPSYSGKVACLLDALGCRPYLCLGDSPGDHSMLTFSENRLWIARLDKPDYQQATANLLRKNGHAHWLFQPVFTGNPAGLVPDLGQLAQTHRPLPPEIRKSTAILSRM
jgi:hypothetical protein